MERFLCEGSDETYTSLVANRFVRLARLALKKRTNAPLRFCLYCHKRAAEVRLTVSPKLGGGTFWVCQHCSDRYKQSHWTDRKWQAELMREWAQPPITTTRDAALLRFIKNYARYASRQYSCAGFAVPNQAYLDQKLAVTRYWRKKLRIKGLVCRDDGDRDGFFRSTAKLAAMKRDNALSLQGSVRVHLDCRELPQGLSTLVGKWLWCHRINARAAIHTSLPNKSGSTGSCPTQSDGP